MRIRNLVILWVTGFLILTTTGLTLFFYQQQRNSLETGINQELQNAAVLVKEILPSGYHDRIDGKNPVLDENYQRITGQLNDICQKTGLKYLWSALLVDGNMVITSGTPPEKNSNGGAQKGFYEIYPDSQMAARAFETMQPQFQIVDHHDGRMAIVLVPNQDVRGRKFLIGASRGMQSVDASLHNFLINSLLLNGGTVILGILAGFIFSSSLTRPFDYFNKIISKIKSGDYDELSDTALSQVGSPREYANHLNDLKLLGQAVQTRDISVSQLVEARMIRQREQLRLLDETSQRLYGTLNLKEIYQTAGDFISVVVPNEGFFFSAFDHETQTMICRVCWTGADWLDVSLFPPVSLEEAEIQSPVIRTGKSLLINDYSAHLKTSRNMDAINDEIYKIVPGKSPEDVIRSALIVPLKTETRVTGIIQVNSFRLNAYTENQLNLLESLASHIVLAEQNALLYDRAQRELNERRQVEEALNHEKILMEAIFNSVPGVIYLYNQQGYLIRWNKKHEELTGYSTEELDHFYVLDWYKGELDDIDRVTKGIEKTRTEGFASAEANLITKNGSTILFDFTAARVNIGDEIYFTGIGIDISDRRKAENQVKAAQVELQRLLSETELSRRALLSVVEDQKEAQEQIERLNAELEQRVADRTAQLTAANQELEAFSYSVSHDLRGPLRTLDGYSHVLLEDYAGQLDEDGKHYLTRIQEASRRMGQLINDLLNLSRITRSDFIRQRVDLSLLAAKIAADLKTQAPHRQIEFKISSNMTVEGDQNLLTIVLENLMNNACKFTGQCTHALIQVGMLEQGGEKIYYVRDNGAGFDMEYAHKLFAPFQRLHGPNEFPGTGIGLSIVQRIITRHGGRIWPEGVVGHGATFYFTIGKTENNLS